MIPGGDELVVRSRSRVRIFARDMSSGTSFELPDEFQNRVGYGIAASEQFVYVTGNYGAITSLTHDGTEVAKYEVQDPEMYIYSPILAPGGLLFGMLGDCENPGLGGRGEIIALDAQTLQPRHRFGLSLLNDASGMVVVGEELFVCDLNNDRL